MEEKTEYSVNTGEMVKLPPPPPPAPAVQQKPPTVAMMTLERLASLEKSVTSMGFMILFCMGLIGLVETSISLGFLFYLVTHLVR